MSQYSEDLQEIADNDTLEDIGNKTNLVVYNDDVNTFAWVIECFIEVLGHTSEQAEQLSLLIHFKGKATVLTGSFEILKPKKDALIDRGLSAVIEEFVN